MSITVELNSAYKASINHCPDSENSGADLRYQVRVDPPVRDDTSLKPVHCNGSERCHDGLEIVPSIHAFNPEHKTFGAKRPSHD